MSSLLQLSRTLRYAAFALYRHASLVHSTHGAYLCMEYYAGAVTCANFLDAHAHTIGKRFEHWCTRYIKLIDAALDTKRFLKSSEAMTTLIGLIRTVTATLQTFAPDDPELTNAACSTVLTPYVLKMIVTEKVPPHARDLYMLAAVAQWCNT